MPSVIDRRPAIYRFYGARRKALSAGNAGQQRNRNPVDVLSEMVIVLNSSWQVVWYYDAFNNSTSTAPRHWERPARPAFGLSHEPLSEHHRANDWTHANTVDYVAASSAQNPDSGDFLVSMRDQDQVIKAQLQQRRGQLRAAAGRQLHWLVHGPSGQLTVRRTASLSTTSLTIRGPGFRTSTTSPMRIAGRTVTVDGLTGSITGSIVDDFR
jgi:hypothetical protein